LRNNRFGEEINGVNRDVQKIEKKWFFAVDGPRADP
jgi:hypothetical protein